MQCPAGCSSTPVMSERLGVEIDYCPTCRGVWLDRGELDKILERSASDLMPAGRPGYDDDDDKDRDRFDRGHDRDRDDRYDKHRKKKKRRSFLEDIFEFE